MLATTPVSPCAHLIASVDDLAREPIEHHTTQALGDDLVTLRREIDRLEADFIRRLERFDRGHGAHAEAAPSTASWLRARCGLTGAAAVERVRMARMLSDLPLTSASFRAGRAPFTNVSLIARLASEVGTEATRGVEQTLVTAAEKLDPGRMYRLTAHTRHVIDADGALDKDRRDYERRWFSCEQTYDGVYVLQGQLDTEGGALVKAALDASSTRFGRDDQRSGSQRRADALVHIAETMLRTGDLPTVHGQRPHLVLTASLAALQRQPGAEPAVLAGAGPIHAETARRIACDASVRVAMHVTRTGDRANRTDRSYSIGRESRTVPAPMRSATGLRDDGCRFPGCDRPLGWTQAHHIDHWADTGRTEVPNLVSLCHFHHRVVHEQGRELRMLPDGSVEVSAPGARDPTHAHHP